MIIVAMNGLFLILFPKYIINHIHSAGLPGIVQALIYIILISNLVYGLVVYFVAVSTEEQYHTMRTPMIIIGFSYLGFDLLLAAIIGTITLIVDGTYCLLLIIVLPDVLDIGIIGISMYSIHHLYKEKFYMVIPLQPMVNY